mgnify:CR=1 FL=1
MTKYAYYFLILFSFLQLFILRYSSIKINTIKILISVIFLIFILNIYFLNINLLFLSIFIVYIYFCFFITVPGILYLGPSIYLIKLIRENKNTNKTNIKKKFLHQSFVKKRLKENLTNNFILKKNNKLILSNVGICILFFFDKILKIFKLKSDV